MLLVGAGVGAGLVSSVAGLASLFSYPALLAVGLPPVTANVTNTVALMFSTVGSVSSSRPELHGQGITISRFAPLVTIGGAAGAGLLLVTPSAMFEGIVPFLIGGASVALLAKSRIRVAAASATSRRSDLVFVAAVFGISIYAGYFGAAAGVLMLALLVVRLPLSLLQCNAVKNVLVGLANGVAALGFAVFADVRWSAVLPLAVGLLIGGWTGPVVARRIPATALRVGVALAGIGLAIKLGIDAY